MANERTNKVSPRLIAGFQDLSPQDMILKRRVMEILIKQFELFGFNPFDSATVHWESVLFGEDWTDMAYFRTWNTQTRMTPDSEKMALRFDLTVPLGRYVAKNIETIPRPFARWQIGNVFRGEKPSVGRYREFTQCDADILFAPGIVSDAQIVALMSSVMKALGVGFQIKVNNRKILNGLPIEFKFDPEILVPVLQILDKRDKIGEEGILFELQGSPDDKGEFQTMDLGLSNRQIEQLIRFSNIYGKNSVRLDKVEVIMRSIPIAMEGISELRELLSLAAASGVEESNILVDLSMVRGLGYYTGPIFETILTDQPELGSVFAGGRYDNLVGRYSDAIVPATGASFGIDRFLAYAKSVGLYSTPLTMNQVVVAYQPDALEYATRIAAELRDAGIRSLLYDGQDLSFRHPMGLSNTLEIPWVIIVGSREVADGTISLRNMRDRKQEITSVSEAALKILAA